MAQLRWLQQKLVSFSYTASRVVRPIWQKQTGRLSNLYAEKYVAVRNKLEPIKKPVQQRVTRIWNEVLVAENFSPAFAKPVKREPILSPSELQRLRKELGLHFAKHASIQRAVIAQKESSGGETKSSDSSQDKSLVKTSPSNQNYLSDTLSTVTAYFPTIPLSTLTDFSVGFFLNRNNESEEESPKTPKKPTVRTRNDLKQLVTKGFKNVQSKSSSVQQNASDAKSTSNFKAIGKKSMYTKASVDARTIQCIRRLLNPPSETACLRRLEEFCKHLELFPWAKGLAVREAAVGVVLKIRRRTNNDSVKIQVAETLSRLGYEDPFKGRGLRILAIDGGGMRGIIALEILKEIEATTGQRIYQLFDYIVGVSTGAIIASFIGLHKQSIQEIEETYNTIGLRVFTQSVWDGTRGWVMSHSYYNTEMYEKVLQSFVGETIMSDTIRTAGTPKLGIVATLVSDDRIVPYVFRNYHFPPRTQSNFKGSSTEPIWAAVRASSAAPGYFDEFHVGTRIFHDGGILTNNATQIAIHEASKLWPNSKLQCVVSLGLGRFEPLQFTGTEETVKPKALSLAQKFHRIVDSATDTEMVHETLHDLLPGNVYYRFNPYLREYLPLDETRPEKMAVMREDSRMYVRRNYNKVMDACLQLQLEKSWPRRLWDEAEAQFEMSKARAQHSILPGIKDRANFGKS